MEKDGADIIMTHQHRPLLAPVSVAGLDLRNRIAMAPMTRERSPGGVPGADVAAYYRRRAEGGVGLIITEGTAPDAQGAFGADVPRFYGEDALAGWRGVVDAVHGAGAKIVPQIWHVGAFDPGVIGMAESLSGVGRISPSGLAAPDRALGRAMTLADVDTTIAAFAEAAGNAKTLGFDGVELHGAHGYLIDQFLWAGTNRREDAYAHADRTRFACELIAACRARVGADFPILLRLSQWKQLDHNARLADDPAALDQLVGPLAAAGVDMFHCSTRRFWEPAFDSAPWTLSGWVRRLSGRPTILVGSVTLRTDFKAPDGKIFAAADEDDVSRLEALLERGEFDLVAIGRALIANPDWPRLLAEGRLAEMRPFERAMLDVL